MKLANKVALITGAGKGIGRGIALELAKEGADIIVNYHASSAGAEEVAEAIRQLGHRCMTIQADIGDWKQAQEMVDRGWNEFGHIDILVNNAGITLFSDFFEITEQDWDRVLDTNLKGAFACSQAVATRLKNANLPGRIIHIGSIHSLVTVPFVTQYAASKGGLDAMTRQMALALAPFHITVNTVAPGLVEVERIVADPLYNREERAKQIPIGRVGTPEDIGRICAFFASDDSEYITGQILHANGGQSAKIAMRRGNYE